MDGEEVGEVGEVDGIETGPGAVGKETTDVVVTD
jgi:hypothetical protein